MVSDGALHSFAAAVPLAPLGSPCALGLLTGLLLVCAPDHLGTLLALTAGISDASRAFVVGLSWGLGHSAGMLLTCLVVIVVAGATPDIGVWEVVGNYCAGILMISVGLYFVFREELYLDRKADGSYAARACCCSGASAAAAGVPEPPTEQRGGAAEAGAWARKRSQNAASTLCSMNYGAGKDRCIACPRENIGGSPAEEATPLLRSEEAVGGGGRSARTAVIGLVQAMLCPSCLMGLGPAYQVAAAHDVGAVRTALEFLTCAGLTSTLGVALLAAAWTQLTAHGVGGRVSPLALYRGSCCLTILLGATWIALNACGMMRVMEFAEPHHVTSLLGLDHIVSTLSAKADHRFLER